MLDATPSRAGYTLSLHDALPIYRRGVRCGADQRKLHRAAADVGERDAVRADGLEAIPQNVRPLADESPRVQRAAEVDRKSTRLNSSHTVISYAVFCLKKKTRTDS